MAKKKSKADPKDLGPIVDKMIDEVGDDRNRLVKFLDGLIDDYDGEKAVGIAEYVAKLADALTRQHQVKTAVINAISKSTPGEDDESDLDDIQDKIGLPFQQKEVDDGSN